MSFQLTYSTMFNPPAELHQRFDAAVARVVAGLGRRYGCFIDGADRSPATTKMLHSPIDRELVLGEFADASAAEADIAMQAAHRAFAQWRKTSMTERMRLLRKAAVLMEARVYEIAAALTLEVGKNRMEALGEAQETVDFFRVYCDHYEREGGFYHPLPNDPVNGYISRNRSVMKPHGAWVVITPFNFPFALAGGPVAAALVTGNTVVLKGATTTPWAGRLLADCMRDAGFPAGVFNYVSGSGRVVGEALISHPLTAGVTFTGSYETGMAIARKMLSGAYPRPCIAEMGGKNACIVTAEADLERAALGITRSAFGMAGQKCSALSRLYVHSSVADKLIEQLQQHLGEIRIGNPLEQKHWLGPVATEAGYRAYGEYSALLRTQGSRLLIGGHYLRDGDNSRGYYVKPTLAEASDQHPLWQQEMFLPILMINRCSSNDEAMAKANATPLGLTAGIYGSRDEVSWFHEHIEAGVTYANRPQGATTGAWPGYQPFGGWKGSSTTGKAIASFYYLAQYLREQSQTVVE
ncbi:aldehyde dehydrogenase family protein [Permianibacter sp. IMCC34836]|uniref:aldehyde dehydrogenase family protein n=1 Tax=Permianibacter fluminis TaxID=2738515 RepID=UPI001555DC32|nr:aldehyde dehydrogenase family protein [Permianibacter fluminis]NQD36357.1 aldehyde dehydrogenase family protein [Permianibacter fluminis]